MWVETFKVDEVEFRLISEWHGGGFLSIPIEGMAIASTEFQLALIKAYQIASELYLAREFEYAAESSISFARQFYETEESWHDFLFRLLSNKYIHDSTRSKIIEELNNLKHRKDLQRKAIETRLELSREYPVTYKFLVQRDGEKCKLCGATEKLQIDHVSPVINGGKNDPQNLQLLCKTCNSKKGAKEAWQ